MSAFVPAYEVVEAKGAAVGGLAVLLHGILGSRRNWLGFARRVVEHYPGVRVLLVDLRNHGDSAGAPPPHTLAACAEDLAHLAAHLGEEPRAVIGHSYGGKVALVYARDVAASLDDVWALDSSPGTREQGVMGSVERVIAAVASVPMPIAGRKELVDKLLNRGLPLSVAQWMTTNLRPAGAGFAWRFDLGAVGQMLDDYGAHDLWPFLEHPPAGPRVHFVRGGKSDRWTPQDVARFEVARERGLDVHTLEGAGHWLHTDDPDGLFAALSTTFAALQGG